ncbi:MAG: hypothetical protein LBR21_10505 [Propionibacteriaceae bacterium]|jgi:hypothetical protein|nr:hypothetical protein [Propionibacteriaceae bacterium]
MRCLLAVPLALVLGLGISGCVEPVGGIWVDEIEELTIDHYDGWTAGSKRWRVDLEEKKLEYYSAALDDDPFPYPDKTIDLNNVEKFQSAIGSTRLSWWEEQYNPAQPVMDCGGWKLTVEYADRGQQVVRADCPSAMNKFPDDYEKVRQALIDLTTIDLFAYPKL